MEVFFKTIKVKHKDLDQLQHVNNVRYVQWVQDIAEAHWLKNASDEILNQYFWVLLSHHIDYKSPAVLDDIVRIETFVEQSEGVTSIRKVNMYNDSTDKLLVTSTTKWCFMSKDTLRPTRITQEIAGLFN